VDGAHWWSTGVVAVANAEIGLCPEEPGDRETVESARYSIPAPSDPDVAG
jgi:hypothetical protein